MQQINVMQLHRLRRIKFRYHCKWECKYYVNYYARVRRRLLKFSKHDPLRYNIILKWRINTFDIYSSMKLAIDDIGYMKYRLIL